MGPSCSTVGHALWARTPVDDYAEVAPPASLRSSPPPAGLSTATCLNATATGPPPAFFAGTRTLPALPSIIPLRAPGYPVLHARTTRIGGVLLVWDAW